MRSTELVLSVVVLTVVFLIGTTGPAACRVNLRDMLEPIAKEIGFGRVAEIATLGLDGVPISLLYFERQGA